MSYHKEFPVGSIVYFLHKERVLPAQVHEKIVRTSLEGSRATYLLSVRSRSKAPSQDGFSIIELDPEKTEAFQTPNEIKDFMVARATEAIERLVETAVTASSFFEGVVSSEEAKTPDPLEDQEDFESWHVPAAERPLKNAKKENKEYAEVDLGDGRKARLRV
jgi:hypothetical protein